MNYASLLISAIVFFMSLSLLVMTWAKKPTKKHIKEMEEAGEEIVQQIQEATEESIMKIEGKIKMLDEKMALYETVSLEKEKKQQELAAKAEEIPQQCQQITTQSPRVNIDMRDKKVKELYELYSKGYSAKQIAKELGMYAGVVEVYVNLFEMNKAM